MGYHGCPIEPSDWTHGPADEPEMDARCPKCGEEAEGADPANSSEWKCTDKACGWTGPEPEWVEPPDHEPDMAVSITT